MPKSRRFPFLVVLLLWALGAPATNAEKHRSDKTTSLPPRFEKWLKEEVIYIVSAEERRQFLSLQVDKDREQFVERFWARRDPTELTPENEFRDEHYRRLAFANDHFGGKVPGWKTDRGRVFIMHGAPSEIESFPAGHWKGSPPLECWRYNEIEGVGEDIILVFADVDGTGDYRLKGEPPFPCLEFPPAGS